MKIGEVFEVGGAGRLVCGKEGGEDRRYGLLGRRITRVVAWWSEIAFHLKCFENTARPRPHILRGPRTLHT